MNASLQRRQAALAIAATLGVAYAYFYQGGGWNQNTRFALVRAIVEHQTLRIDDTAMVRGRAVSGDLARHDGHLYSDKAPGASFVAVPAVLFAGGFVDDPTSREGIATLSWVATMAAAAAPTVACALLLFHVCTALGLGTAAGAFAALAFGLATPAWAYATLLFGHALAGACLMAAFAAALALDATLAPGAARTHQASRALRRSGDRTRDAGLGLLVGLAGGWATVTEYPCAIPAALLALLAIANAGVAARRASVAAGVGAGALACIAVLASHNAAAFGSALSLGYAHEAGDFGGLKQGFMGITWPKVDVLAKILFGPYRGLFFHSPVLALAPVGLWLLVAAPASRRAAVAASAIVAYFLLLNSAYFYWFGGACFGPRHVLPAVPFLALGLAALFARWTRPLRMLLLAFAAGSAFVTLVAVSTTVQQPEWFRSPWTEYNWPAFSKGHLALNQMSFLDADAVRVRDAVAHSWNLGEKMGLGGLASLLPLFAAWLAIGAAWWGTAGWADSAPSSGDARGAGEVPSAPLSPATSAGPGAAIADGTPKRAPAPPAPKRRKGRR